MPWSGGTYTLPAGTSVVAGGDIEASWANALTLDLQTGVNATLNRDGSNNMTAAVPQMDGTVSVPGISFNNEPTSGWYRAGAEDIRFGLLGIAQYQWTKGAAPNYIPVFSVWDQANTEWKAMPHAFSDTTVAGAWTFEANTTFESTAKFEGTVTVEDTSTQWTSSAADVERVYIDQNDVRIYTDGDTPGPNSGGGGFRIYSYNGTISWRQYVLGKTNTVTSDGSFRLIAYETDGTTTRDTAFKYDWDEKEVVFNTDVTFGESGDPGDNTIDSYDVWNMRDNTFFRGDDSVGTTIYNKLLVDGATSTEAFPPASAVFAKGIECEMPLRIWNQAADGRMDLDWGHKATGASGSYSVGDFKKEYNMGTISVGGGFQFKRYDYAGEDWYFPSIMFFNADSTMDDSYINWYYRTRVHNITGWEGRGLLAEDMDENFNQVGWLLDRQTGYAATDTVPQNDEHRNIVLTGSVDYVLTIDALEDGTWMRFMNLGTATVQLDPDGAALAYLDGSSVAYNFTMDLAPGGWAMIHKRASSTNVIIYGQGLST